MPRSKRASFNAASTPAWPDFPSPIATANGAASTSTFAARWRRRCSATRKNFATRRSPRSSASPRCSRAKSTFFRATPPGRSRATPASASTSSASTIYDGQGFMVTKKRNVKSAKQLNGATVCVQPGTTTELNLADYFRANNMKFKPVVIEKFEEVLNAYFAGRCDVFTTDVSGLVAARASRAANPDDHVILPEVISKEPLGPAVRHGDDHWFDIVKWSLFAMIEGRRARADVEEHRSASARAPTRSSSASSAPRATSARCSVWTIAGPTTSSNRSATTARVSTPLNAAGPRSRPQQALE